MSKVFETEGQDEILQIIPAPKNLFNRIKTQDGAVYSPIVCMALTKGGDIHFCDTDDTGGIEVIESGKGDIYEYLRDADAFTYYTRERQY